MSSKDRYPRSLFFSLISRSGYESSGGFGVDEFIPLPAETARPIAPAYRVFPSAMKLDKKDPGPTGKSGK